MKNGIGENIKRIEAWEKVTGAAKYSADISSADELIARVITSPHAHALILSIDASKAEAMKGVKAVVTGRDYPDLEGGLIEDRPILANELVRYAGEPVAMVIAQDEATASAAVELIGVQYKPLDYTLTPAQSLSANAPLIHVNLGAYKLNAKNIYPRANTNIASEYSVIKGDAFFAMSQSEVVIERRFFLPPSEHMAMEIRSASAYITPEGEINITTSTQAPYAVQERVAKYFAVPPGNVRVRVPYVGGAFGGKVSPAAELLACAASKAVGGRKVRLIFTREQDMVSAPSRAGLEAVIKLGASKNGTITAAQLNYWLDCGAYADISPYMASAIAANGTGPYNIENLSMECACVYTNHTYATSFRGFAHESYIFCIERAMDALAIKCGISPMDIRRINAISPGNLMPTRVLCTSGNTGNLSECLNGLNNIAKLDEGFRVRVDERTVRAKGIACIWKASSPPTNAVSGAVVTFNQDGSANLSTGIIEMGNGNHTRFAQMLAHALHMPVNMIHVINSVDTRVQPKHWKTVASMSGYMAGRAILRAAEDALSQLRAIAAQALSCIPEDVGFMNARAYKISEPSRYIHYRELAHGYKSSAGTSIGDPVIGRGGFMFKGLSEMDERTGEGKPGPSWTVGAQSVEIEIDMLDLTYRLINACTALDVGAAVNPSLTAQVIKGGMAMGLSLSRGEGFSYEGGVMQSPNMRTYKLMHIGEEPDYRVTLIETPQDDAPFGARSYSEHGILGMPAALANAISTALERDIDILPLTPETLWREAMRT